VTAYAVGAAIIQGISANPAAAQGKVAQTSVAYQDKPKGAQVATAVVFFQPPNACKVVDGNVSAQAGAPCLRKDLKLSSRKF